MFGVNDAWSEIGRGFNMPFSKRISYRSSRLIKTNFIPALANQRPGLFGLVSVDENKKREIKVPDVDSMRKDIVRN